MNTRSWGRMEDMLWIKGQCEATQKGHLWTKYKIRGSNYKHNLIMMSQCSEKNLKKKTPEGKIVTEFHSRWRCDNWWRQPWPRWLYGWPCSWGRRHHNLQLPHSNIHIQPLSCPTHHILIVISLHIPSRRTRYPLVSGEGACFDAAAAVMPL